MFHGLDRQRALVTKYGFNAAGWGACSSFLSSTTPQVVNPFSGKYYDSHNAFDLTAGTYTIPDGGLWVIDFWHQTNDSVLADFSIRRDGVQITDYCVAKCGSTAGYWATATLSVSMRLDVGDVLDIWASGMTSIDYDMYFGFSGVKER